MPLTQRYSTVERGAMVLTGNSLTIMNGTSYPANQYDFYNGSYISTNTNLTAATGFPAGTSFNPANSSSSAVLNIPSGSTILYAQLWWSIAPDPGASRDNAITFTTPIGTHSITPTLSDGAGSVYYRGAVVTNIIANSLSGTYTFSNIPGVTISNNATISCYGWYLIVVYKNPSFKYRYFNINTGAVNVANGAPSAFTFSNIATPATGVVKGYLLITEGFGDLADGAEIYVGSTSPGTRIGNNSGTTWDGVAPYAKINNMLPGNILIADTNDPNIGLLDTRGTFGNNNKNPFASTAPGYARMCVDIAGFDISSKLTNNQTSLYTNVNYSGSGSGVVTSQSVQVDLNAPEFRGGNFSMLVDKGIATFGDTLTYTLVLNNTGQATANNVFLMNTIPTGLAYVSGSVIIDGTTNPNSDPRLPGINLGNISAGIVKTIEFKVSVVSLPTANPIQQDSQITYNFLLSAGYGNIFSDQVSTTAITTINAPDFRTSSISVNKFFATITDELTYTVVLKNTGNVAATSINYLNTIPNYTSFKPQSVVIDSVNYPNLNVGSPGFLYPLSINSSAVSTLQYKILVNSIPTINPIINSTTVSYFYTHLSNSSYSSSYSTNTVNTTINGAILSGTKTADKYYANYGDTITYIIAIKNSGNISATNTKILDTIPLGTTFITNSLLVDGAIQSGTTPNTGYVIGTIAAGVATTIQFKVTVNTLPTTTQVLNSALLTYKYTIDPSVPNGASSSYNTNSTITELKNANLGNATKTVSNSYADANDILTYTIVIPNTGNINAANVRVSDTIPVGTTFVQNSLTVNGVQTAEVPTMINIGTIPVGTSATITFKVQISS